MMKIQIRQRNKSSQNVLVPGANVEILADGRLLDGVVSLTLCMRPKQVATLHMELIPTELEIDQAVQLRILEHHAKHVRLEALRDVSDD